MLWKPYCSLYRAFSTQMFDFKGAREILGEATLVTLSRLSNDGLLLTSCSNADGRVKIYRLLDPRDIAYAEATIASVPTGSNALTSVPLCGLPYRFQGATAARIYHGKELSPLFRMEVLKKDVGKWVRFLVALSAQIFVGGFLAPSRPRNVIFDLDPRKKIGNCIEFNGVYLPPPEELLIDLVEGNTRAGYVEGKRLISAVQPNLALLRRVARCRRIPFRKLMKVLADEHVYGA